MGYKLNITDAAENQFDKLVQYLLFELQTPSAASHLMDEIQKIYLRIENECVYVMGIFHQLENYITYL